MTTELLRPEALAQNLGKSPAVLANWRYRGLGPKYIKIGRSVRYSAAAVEEWLEAQTRQQTGEQAS
jgi:predicted DNA-binding transcriptional regulator AlpA